MLCWRCRSGESGAVLPITIMILQRGRAAPLIHHLRPLSTYSSPSRRMVSWILVASELATSGSVIANAERIAPSKSGCSHCALLLRRAELRQNLHVAGIGRATVEDFRRPVHPPGDLSQRRVLEVAEPSAILTIRKEEVPEPCCLGLCLQLDPRSLDDERGCPRRRSAPDTSARWGRRSGP